MKRFFAAVDELDPQEFVIRFKKKLDLDIRSFMNLYKIQEFREGPLEPRMNVLFYYLHSPGLDLFIDPTHSLMMSKNLVLDGYPIASYSGLSQEELKGALLLFLNRKIQEFQQKELNQDETESFRRKRVS